MPPHGQSEKSKNNIEKSVPSVVRVHSVAQAEASIDDFNLREYTPIKAAEIPPLSKTRSGKTDLVEGKIKKVATPNNKKKLDGSTEHVSNSLRNSASKTKYSTPFKDVSIPPHTDEMEQEQLYRKNIQLSLEPEVMGNPIYCSPSKLNIQIDDDISFSIESPSLNCTTNKETPKRILKELQLGNVEQIKSNLEGSFDEDTKSDIEMKKESSPKMTGETDSITQVKMKRHMITAVQGRFICPSENCEFKCESKVILNIHVRKRHIDMFGSPVRKEKMKIRLSKNEIPPELLETISQSENKTVPVQGFRAEGSFSEINKQNLPFNKAETTRNGQYKVATIIAEKVEAVPSAGIMKKNSGESFPIDPTPHIAEILNNTPEKNYRDTPSSTEPIIPEIKKKEIEPPAQIDLITSSTHELDNICKDVYEDMEIGYELEQETIDENISKVAIFYPQDNFHISSTPNMDGPLPNEKEIDTLRTEEPISIEPLKKNVELEQSIGQITSSTSKCRVTVEEKNSTTPAKEIQLPIKIPTSSILNQSKSPEPTLKKVPNTPKNITPQNSSIGSRGVKRKTLCDTENKHSNTEIENTPSMPAKKLCLDMFGKGKGKVTNKENEVHKEKAVEKMRKLQKGKSDGTYVQCSKKSCQKWRFLPEFEDPALIPENWECSMNENKTLNACSKGKSERFVENSDEFIDTEYACGSMVWAKLKGYPWWPGMVDYCPDTDEYYWMDDWDKAKDSKEEHIKLTTSQPSWYHVMFFDVPQVNRSWIKAEDLVKMEDAKKPPKEVRVAKLKTRWNKATNMAVQCSMLEREKRIEKYSFAALFNGKWGHYSDDEEEEQSKSSKKKKQTVEQKNNKGLSVSRASTPDKPKLKIKSRHDWKPSQLLNLWTSPTTAHSKDIPGDWTCNICNKIMPYVENLVVEHLDCHDMTPEDYLEKYEKSDHTGTLIYMLNWKQEKTIGEYLMATGNEYCRKEVVKKEYKRPPLDAESLIALAVKNIDPKNETGATFDEIISFITIIFPYFNQSQEECKAMVLKVYNCTSEDMAKGRFRLRPALLDKLLIKVEKALATNTRAIEEALIFPEFIKRLNTDIVNYDTFKHPGYSDFMLALFAMIALKVPATTEQIAIFLTMVFPHVYKEITSWKKKFSQQMHKEKEFVEIEEKGAKKYKVNEIMWMKSYKILEEFTRMPHNMDMLRQSAFDKEIMPVLFPSLSWH